MKAGLVTTGRPWVLGLVGLLASDAVAQQLPLGQDVTRRASLASVPDAAENRYFFDDFSRAVVDPRNWEAAIGVELARAGGEHGASVAAVRLGGAATLPETTCELRSVAIALTRVPDATLSYTLDDRDVEAGEPLVVEYLSGDGRWMILERVAAEPRVSSGFRGRVCALPSDALHAESRIRFRAAARAGWCLGEVCLSGSEPACTLTLGMRPPSVEDVEVVLEGEHYQYTPPLTRSFRRGTRLHLIAPPVVNDYVFSRWSVNGAAASDGERVLSIKLNQPTEALAVYRPWIRGRTPASVAIVAAPDYDVPIELGPDSERLFTSVITDAEYPCLTGERVTLLAPSRTERAVFVRWVVNGEALPEGRTMLEHRVVGNDFLLAEYVLLGDMNADDLLDKFDVDEFVLALIDPAGYAERHPQVDRLQRGDVNGDGVVDALDIEGFVDLLFED